MAEKNSSLITLFKEQLENESQRIAEDRNLVKRGDFFIWWYFLRLQGLPPSEIEEAVCDDGNDLGLDAIYIDEDDIVHFYQFKNPEKSAKPSPKEKLTASYLVCASSSAEGMKL